MNVKELFIFNETYPLPLDKYAEFKSRKDGCSSNPMCIDRLKSDAETFIADWGKKHGAKIENGEESNFIVLKDFETGVNNKVSNIKNFKEKDTTILIIIGALLVLGAYSLVKKHKTIGVVTVLLALLLLMTPTPKTS
jgi:hypothetical protein